MRPPMLAHVPRRGQWLGCMHRSTDRPCSATRHTLCSLLPCCAGEPTSVTNVDASSSATLILCSSFREYKVTITVKAAASATTCVLFILRQVLQDCPCWLLLQLSVTMIYHMRGQTVKGALQGGWATHNRYNSSRMQDDGRVCASAGKHLFKLNCLGGRVCNGTQHTSHTNRRRCESSKMGRESAYI